jgi:coupling of ubiquitin conjugation to ER degradation protein 1
MQPPPVVSRQGSPNISNSNASNGSASTSRKSPSHPNLVQRYKIDVQKEQQTEEEPPKVWESSPDKRQEMLRKRKEFMVLQARK